jgi:hypothetical protein
VRDTEAPELRGRQGAAATHRAASVAYAVTGAALTGWLRRDTEGNAFCVEPGPVGR